MRNEADLLFGKASAKIRNLSVIAKQIPYFFSLFYYLAGVVGALGAAFCLAAPLVAGF
jgi:hypothetical protein